MTVYVQMKQSGRDLETVDEFETWKEAREMLQEYQMCDLYSEYYLSRRCCRDWAIDKRDREVTPDVTAELRF